MGRGLHPLVYARELSSELVARVAGLRLADTSAEAEAQLDAAGLHDKRDLQPERLVGRSRRVCAGPEQSGHVAADAGSVHIRLERTPIGRQLVSDRGGRFEEPRAQVSDAGCLLLCEIAGLSTARELLQEGTVQRGEHRSASQWHVHNPPRHNCADGPNDRWGGVGIVR